MNGSHDYLLTVVIPTKNRMQYLESCLRALASFQLADLEVVVQDNSEDPLPAAALVRSLGTPNIKLQHTAGQLSQTENSDLAVERASGEFVCYIGDDDCILPELLTTLRDVPADVDALTFPGARYYWEDVVFKRNVYPPLSIPKFTADIKTINAPQAVRQCLRSGASGLGELAGVYHGAVRRTLLDEVKQKTGSYFPGPSPDMANAIAVTLLARRILHCDLPLYVDGFGYHSAGGRGVRGEHKAKLEDVAQIPADTASNWTPSIPKIWLGPTIWAESCIKALTALGREDLLGQLNWPALYGRILIDHPDCAPAVTPLLNDPRRRVATSAATIRYLAWKSLAFVRNVLYTRLRLTDRATWWEKIDLADAISLASDHIRAQWPTLADNMRRAN